MIKNPLSGISGAAYGIIGIVLIIAGVGFWINSLYNDIEDLEAKYLKVNSEKLLVTTDRDRIKLSVERQNLAISKYEADIESVSKELEDWKNRPPEVKWKTRYVREIVEKTKEPSTGNECEELKEILDLVGEVKYDEF